MGTSRNIRSPASVRWRAVHAAFVGSQRPRALGELFVAAETDGWQLQLQSAPIHRFARAASSAWDAIPTILAEVDSPGTAVRTFVDRAHRTALETESYSSAGLMTALADRALTRVLVPRLQTEQRGLHQVSIDAAGLAWSANRATPGDLAATFLSEAIRSLTLHLVLRDGPQLVGGPLGGIAAVQDFAWEMAAVAVGAARPGHEMLLSGTVDRDWEAAVGAAWSSAKEFAILGADAIKQFGSSETPS